MIYGYARVSTKGQAKDGNSLEAQEIALRSAGAIEIYADAFTGTKAAQAKKVGRVSVRSALLFFFSTVVLKTVFVILLMTKRQMECIIRTTRAVYKKVSMKICFVANAFVRSFSCGVLSRSDIII